MIREMNKTMFCSETIFPLRFSMEIFLQLKVRNKFTNHIRTIFGDILLKSVDENYANLLIN
ncbi:hypothetical protein DRO61_04795 [Candidatus Bathyarchaeota archaeon]|nr:MAG: hypothetical protein DRO61_04795 [Candidatus Bathyarchaeota archaeon]